MKSNINVKIAIYLHSRGFFVVIKTLEVILEPQRTKTLENIEWNGISLRIFVKTMGIMKNLSEIMDVFVENMEIYVKTL